MRLEESLETYKLQQERNKRLLDLQKNYIDILVDTLREHYYGEENILQNYQQAYRTLYSTALQSPIHHFRGFELQTTNMSAYLALNKNLLPIRHEITIPYAEMIDKTQEIVYFFRQFSIRK